MLLPFLLFAGLKKEGRKEGRKKEKDGEAEVELDGRRMLTEGG